MKIRQRCLYLGLFCTCIIILVRDLRDLFIENEDTKGAGWRRIPKNYILSKEDFNLSEATLDSWQRELCSSQGRMIYHSLENEGFLELPLIHRDITPKVTSDNIFLIESSCSSRPTYRNWCSVESWAYQNRKKELWYLMTSPFIADPTGVAVRLLDAYSNIRVVRANLTEIFADTPLEKLFVSKEWLRESAWPPNNLSNMLRAALVWRWGGLYTDTDVICVKNTGNLSNVVAIQSKEIVNNAVLHGRPRHQVFWKLMEDIGKNFNGKAWGHNGPTALTRVMKKECNVTLFDRVVSNGTQCHDMTILNMNDFYPIPYEQNEKFLDSNIAADRIEMILNSSYALHFWNKLTKTKPIQAAKKSILEEASKRFCPITYKLATSHSNFF